MVLSGSLVVVLLLVLWFFRKKFKVPSVIFGVLLGAVIVTSTPWGPSIAPTAQNALQKALSAGSDALGAGDAGARP